MDVQERMERVRAARRKSTRSCQECGLTMVQAGKLRQYHETCRRRRWARAYRSRLKAQSVNNTGASSSADTPVSLRHQFEMLAEKWRNETGMYSMDTRKVSHPAYLRIISMSDQAIPLILNELRERGGHWYQALEAILGDNPIRVSGTVGIPELKEKWLDWGRQQGYIS